MQLIYCVCNVLNKKAETSDGLGFCIFPKEQTFRNSTTPPLGRGLY